MEEITIYEKPTCSTCRVAVKLLDEHGDPYRRVRYHDTPLSEEKLGSLIKKMGIPAVDLLRTGDPAFRALNVKPEELSESGIIRLMVQYPDTMQRPIVERGDRTILGRPVERISEFLKGE